jgi:hypothetical protein
MNTSADRRPRTVAFVGSLLPARFLLERGVELNVYRIVVLNRTHQRSFEYLSRHIPESRVSRLGGGQLVAAALLAGHLVAAKLMRRRVLFFHECCWPLFDLLVSAVRPRGLFVPQVTMDGFDTISVDEMPPSASLIRRLTVAAFKPWLRSLIVYRAPKDSGEQGYNYLLAMRTYPRSIEVSPLARRPDPGGGRPAHEPIAPGAVPRILLIGGTEPVPDEDLRRLYTTVAEIGRAEGYDVSFKDHPIHSMGFEGKPCAVIDPALPMELVTERFAFSIGVASTAIFGVGDRKLSIMNLLEAMPEPVRQLRRERLLSHPDSDPGRVEFVADLEALGRILRGARDGGAQHPQIPGHSVEPDGH